MTKKQKLDFNFEDTSVAGNDNIPVPDKDKRTENKSYLEQLEYCISQVLEEESHLVNSDWLQMFLVLPEAPKSLFIRLFLRKHRWIRVDNLTYVLPLQDSIRHLESIGFVETNGPDELFEWLELLVKSELMRLCHELGIKAASSALRSDMVKLLLDHNDTMLYVMKHTGPVVRITQDARTLIQQCIVIHERLREWPHNDQFMTVSILTNLSSENTNKVTFMKLNIVRSGIIWPTQSDFVDFFEGLKLEQRVKEFLENQEWVKAAEAVETIRERWKQAEEHITGLPWLNMFTPGWVYTRILGNGYSAYFRLKHHVKCQGLLQELLSQQKFCKTHRGYWYDELAKITERYVDKDGAKQVCLDALSDPFVVTHHRRSIVKRLTRLCHGKKLPIVIRDWVDDDPFPSRTIQASRINSKGRLVLEGERGETTVEQFALEYFAKEGWKGLHTENSIVMTLFGILFWDILYDDSVPGVFHSPFQPRPLDLYTEYFYLAREEKIEKRLLEIEMGKASLIVEKVSTEYRSTNTVGVGVNWKRFTDLEMVQITECIGGTALANICRCFAKSMWAHSGGVPDLCLWKPDSKLFKLAEVKSENDRLSQKQTEWMNMLRSWGVDVEVVHVVYSDLE